MSILEKVNSHEDLLKLSNPEREQLCGEIRSFLVESVSKTGGHLAGNLGVVELSVAIETVFNTMEDRLVFDVGHQSYVHKLLTGRRADFAHLRQYGGISGFPKPEESRADSFVAGHASNAVSIALGMARARTLLGQNYNVVALIGDGACTGGMAYEGLNDAAVSGEPMVIILNDNEMSIGKNVGGLSRHLSRLRSSKKYVDAKQVYRRFMKKTALGRSVYEWSSRAKNRLKRFLLASTIFENMGFTYLGPVDGHDLPGLIDVLSIAKDFGEPVVVHVITTKGKGYRFAEEDPAKFHGISSFDPATGKKLGAKKETFSSFFGKTMEALAQKNERVCAITAAMPGGTGLLSFQKRFPSRTFEVGISEEHAVSMAAGLAKQGMIPVVAIYSTFLQRSFDQLMEDVGLLQMHVVLAVDRAGLVGDDGPTHHGVFDVGYLRQVPGMRIMTPVSFAEQRDMLTWAVEQYSAPVAIRYPRGSEGSYTRSDFTGEAGKLTHLHRPGRDVVFVTYGMLLYNVLEAAELLEKAGIGAAVLRLLCVCPVPAAEIAKELPEHATVIVAEETARNSGIHQELAWQLARLCPGCRVEGLDLGTGYVPHGSNQELYRHCALDGASIAAYTREVLGR